MFNHTSLRTETTLKRRWPNNYPLRGIVCLNFGLVMTRVAEGPWRVLEKVSRVVIGIEYMGRLDLSAEWFVEWSWSGPWGGPRDG